jgi:hypothetical protein
LEAAYLEKVVVDTSSDEKYWCAIVLPVELVGIMGLESGMG